jgi:hypothetical protein
MAPIVALCSAASAQAFACSCSKACRSERSGFSAREEGESQPDEELSKPKAVIINSVMYRFI